VKAPQSEIDTFCTQSHQDCGMGAFAVYYPSHEFWRLKKVKDTITILNIICAI
jgi:hypothetical protein